MPAKLVLERRSLRFRLLAAAVLAGASAAAAPTARAEGSTPPASARFARGTLRRAPAASVAPPRELRHVSPRWLGAEFGVSLALSATLYFGMGAPPARCGWCRPDGFDEAVRGALRARNPRTPAALSHAFSAAAAPALAAGALLPPALMSGRPAHALENTVIALDALMLTFGVTQATKRLTARARPAVYHGVVGATEFADRPAEYNRSFFSSDTAVAFALGSSAATLAYLRGYAIAPWVVFAGSILGAGTACLRIAADMHWATDVLAGAAVGTAIGFAVPYFLHGPARSSARPAPVLVPVLGRGFAGLVTGVSF